VLNQAEGHARFAVVAPAPGFHRTRG
jgi:hypothetical protein